MLSRYGPKTSRKGALRAETRLQEDSHPGKGGPLEGNEAASPTDPQAICTGSPPALPYHVVHVCVWTVTGPLIAGALPEADQKPSSASSCVRGPPPKEAEDVPIPSELGKAATVLGQDRVQECVLSEAPAFSGRCYA